jgi:CRISPR-associated protein Cas2
MEAAVGRGRGMMTLLIYDIANDRRRAKAADVCKDFGLARIQYSAFLGEITHARQGELLQKLSRCLHETDARVHLFPLCEKDMRLTRVLARGEMAADLPFRPALWSGRDAG